VLLLEQAKLTAGTSWHAAGLIETFGSLNETSTEIRKYSRDLYAQLEEETGLSTGWKQCGFIELASTRDYFQQFQRIAAFNRRLGVEVHEISPSQISSLFPLTRVDDVYAGFYVPHDGRVNPVDVTMSLAKGAKLKGVTFQENARVEACYQLIPAGPKPGAGKLGKTEKTDSCCIRDSCHRVSRWGNLKSTKTTSRAAKLILSVYVVSRPAVSGR